MHQSARKLRASTSSGLLVFGQRIRRLIDLEQKVGTGAMSITSVRTRDRDDAPKPCVDLQKFDDLLTEKSARERD
jgi:hypothetical protein